MWLTLKVQSGGQAKLRSVSGSQAACAAGVVGRVVGSIGFQIPFVGVNNGYRLKQERSTINAAERRKEVATVFRASGWSLRFA